MVEVDDGKGGKIKVPGAYRSIVLDSNAGGNSFHFHAGNIAGTARITCAVTNPADQLVSSASVDIVVGAATGKPASRATTIPTINRGEYWAVRISVNANYNRPLWHNLS